MDPADSATVVELLTLDEAIRVTDEPFQPPSALPSFSAYLRYGWDGEPPEYWALRESGRVIGRVGVSLPRRDNVHMAGLRVGVHPLERRKGHGSRLLERGLSYIRSRGRRVVQAHTVDAPGPIAFAERHGFKRASSEIERRLDLSAIDWNKIVELNARAREAAADYTLERFLGPVPAERLNDMAVLMAAINDAPTDDLDIEDEVFDADRIREFDQAQVRMQRRVYRLIARRGTDGPLAGHTIVGIDLDRPGYAGQYDTSVIREHRGHRLGLLLKTEMMLWLREAEPGVRWIDTGNAESNAHMIAINEALGYEVMTRYLGWQRHLDV